jgi:hypothetical protein
MLAAALLAEVAAYVEAHLGDSAGVGPQVPQVAEALHLLYLHGLSSGDFTPAIDWVAVCGPGGRPLVGPERVAQAGDPASGSARNVHSQGQGVGGGVMVVRGVKGVLASGPVVGV